MGCALTGLSLDTLAALCDILDVGVDELIEITETGIVYASTHPWKDESRGGSTVQRLAASQAANPHRATEKA